MGRPRLGYFAYGANMAAATMTAWCPDHELVGPARLDDHRLAFTRRSIRWRAGVADIVAAPGERVWGVLYRLGPGALEALDVKEGTGFAYRRREVVVRLGDGRPRRALAYEVIDKSAETIPPRPEYLELLAAAARERGLPDGYVRRLAGTKPA